MNDSESNNINILTGVSNSVRQQRLHLHANLLRNSWMRAECHKLSKDSEWAKQRREKLLQKKKSVLKQLIASEKQFSRCLAAPQNLTTMTSAMKAQIITKKDEIARQQKKMQKFVKLNEAQFSDMEAQYKALPSVRRLEKLKEEKMRLLEKISHAEASNAVYQDESQRFIIKLAAAYVSSRKYEELQEKTSRIQNEIAEKKVRLAEMKAKQAAAAPSSPPVSLMPPPAAVVPPSPVISATAPQIRLLSPVDFTEFDDDPSYISDNAMSLQSESFADDEPDLDMSVLSLDTSQSQLSNSFMLSGPLATSTPLSAEAQQLIAQEAVHAERLQEKRPRPEFTPADNAIYEKRTRLETLPEENSSAICTSEASWEDGRCDRRREPSQQYSEKPLSHVLIQEGSAHRAPAKNAAIGAVVQETEVAYRQPMHTHDTQPASVSFQTTFNHESTGRQVTPQLQKSFTSDGHSVIQHNSQIRTNGDRSEILPQNHAHVLNPRVATNEQNMMCRQGGQITGVQNVRVATIEQNSMCRQGGQIIGAQNVRVATNEQRQGGQMTSGQNVRVATNEQIAMCRQGGQIIGAQNLRVDTNEENAMGGQMTGFDSRRREMAVPDYDDNQPRLEGKDGRFSGSYELRQEGPIVTRKYSQVSQRPDDNIPIEHVTLDQISKTPPFQNIPNRKTAYQEVHKRMTSLNQQAAPGASGSQQWVENQRGNNQQLYEPGTYAVHNVHGTTHQSDEYYGSYSGEVSEKTSQQPMSLSEQNYTQPSSLRTDDISNDALVRYAKSPEPDYGDDRESSPPPARPPVNQNWQPQGNSAASATGESLFSFGGNGQQNGNSGMFSSFFSIF